MKQVLVANGTDIVGQVRVSTLEDLKDPKKLKKFTKPQKKEYTAIERVVIYTALAALSLKRIGQSDLDCLLTVLDNSNIKMDISEARKKLEE